MHPHLFLDKDDISQLRRRLQDKDFNRPNVLGVTYSQIWKEIMKVADSTLRRKSMKIYEGTYNYPEGYLMSLVEPEQPPRHSFRHPFWTGICGSLSRDMTNLALAYVLAGERAYLERCRSMVLSICEWEVWSDPDYPTPERPFPCCLDTWSLLSGIATAFDLLYDEFTGEEREKIKNAMIEKGIIPIRDYALKKGTWLYSPERWPNGYAMLHAGFGIGALSLLGECREAEEWVEFEKEKTLQFLDREVGPDGGLIEGLGYGNAAIAPLLKFMVALERTTGDSMLDHPAIRNVMLLALYTLAPGGKTAVNFCDAGGPEGCKPTFSLLMAYLAAVKGNKYAQWYLAETGLYKEDWGRDNLFKILWFNPSVEARIPSDLPRYRHFRYTGWVVMRSGWGPSDTLVAFKSGPYRGHGHTDQNSFIINCSGEWLLNDKGYQRYERPYPSDTPDIDEEKIRLMHVFSHDTIGHNCVLVDGRGQERVGGKIVEFNGWNFGATVVGDASEAYPNLTKALRRLIFIEPNTIIVRDILESDRPRMFSFLMHTTKEGKVKTHGREITIEAQKSRLRAYVIKPEEVTIEVKTYPYPRTREEGHYVEIRNKEKSPRGEFLIALQTSSR